MNPLQTEDLPVPVVRLHCNWCDSLELLADLTDERLCPVCYAAQTQDPAGDTE